MQLILGSDGTILTSTTRKLEWSWLGSKSSWRPEFARSTLSPFSPQSPSLPGRQYKQVIFLAWQILQLISYLNVQLFSWKIIIHEFAGLYPESHGIVGNQFYDREVSQSSNCLQIILLQILIILLQIIIINIIFLQISVILLPTKSEFVFKAPANYDYSPSNHHHHHHSHHFVLKSPQLSLIEKITTWWREKEHAACLYFQQLFFLI